MYNNRHGRFTAVDPLLASGKSANPQTFNRYVYVGNNPVIMTDPTGLIGDYYTRSGRFIGSDNNPDDKNVYFADIDRQEGNNIYVQNVDVTTLGAVGAARTMARELSFCGSQCAGIRDLAKDSENAYAFREGARGFGNGFVNQAKSWADIPSYDINPGTALGLGFLFSENSLASNGLANPFFSYTASQNEYQAAGQVGGRMTFDFALTAGVGGAASGVKSFFSLEGVTNLASASRTRHILASDANGGGHAWFRSWKSTMNGIKGEKTMFPMTWSNRKIMTALSEVATNPSSTSINQTGRQGASFTNAGNPAKFLRQGFFSGRKTTVVIEGDQIITGF